MVRTIRSPLARFDDESGFTLVEMMVALAIMGVVMAIFLGTLAWVQTGLVRETARSNTMDQARLALEAIDRQVRSGSVLFAGSSCAKPSSVTDPSTSATYTVPANYGLTIYTRGAYSTSAAFGWVQYAVANNALWTREYTSSGGNVWSSWRSIASGIINATLSTGTTTDVPFALDTSSNYTSSSGASRVVNVVFVVNSKTSDTTATNARLTSAFAIRNQPGSTSSDNVACTAVPTG